MSSRTLPRRAPASKFTAKKRKKSKPGWLVWWPVLLGIAVTPLARRAADVLAMEGPGALQLLYPYVGLLKLHALRLPEEMASTLSQAVIYLQFPVYGLFLSLMLRSHGTVRPLLWTALLHILPLALLMAVAYA